MDSVINKLTEIEEAADAIVAHAEEQKAVLDKEYEERKKAFDKELEAETQSELSKIQEELEKDKKGCWTASPARMSAVSGCF